MLLLYLKDILFHIKINKANNKIVFLYAKTIDDFAITWRLVAKGEDSITLYLVLLIKIAKA